MHWNWKDGWSGWNWALMMIGMVLFWGFVVWGLMSLVRSQGPSRDAQRTSPGRIVAERFAAGDIDSGEYHQRLDALRSSKTPARSGITTSRGHTFHVEVDLMRGSVALRARFPGPRMR